jgi:diguanylate cyclase (GGDEF)-like protein
MKDIKRLGWHFLWLCLCWQAATGWAQTAVVVQLRWKHQFQFAGYYAALEKGYYRDAGLDVTLKEGGSHVSSTDEVLQGRAQFGVTNSGLVKAYMQGKPVLMLAPILQHSPAILLSLGDQLRDPAQVATAGLIRLQPGDESLEHKALFVNEGIALDKLRITNEGVGIEDLLSGKVAAINAYRSNEPFLLQQRGLSYSILEPSHYGMDFYSDVLFTSRAVEQAQPKVVADFRSATLKGWQYALAHSDELIDLILARYNTQNKSREHLQFEAQTINALINPELIQIGHSNPWRWSRIAEVYRNIGMMESRRELDAFFYDPSPVHDLAWVYRSLGFSLLLIASLGSVAFYIFRINKKLRRSLTELSAAQETVLQMAMHDALTGLPSRRLLEDRMHQALAIAKRDQTKLALLFVDIDEFKPINDLHGHDAGDALLQQTAARMIACVRESDTVARFGGDEFIVLLRNVNDASDACLTAEKIRSSLNEPLELAGHRLSISCSLGLALYPEHGGDYSELTKNADLAMYQAKHHGGNCVRVFEREPAESEGH